MKKILAMIFAILMLFNLVACGNKENRYYGTWDFVKISNSEGDFYTKEELEEMGVYEFSSFRLVFQEDGKVHFFMEGEKITADWEKTDNGVKIAAYYDILCIYEDSLLYFEAEDFVVYLSKTSNSQLVQPPENS